MKMQRVNAFKSKCVIPNVNILDRNIDRDHYTWKKNYTSGSKVEVSLKTFDPSFCAHFWTDLLFYKILHHISFLLINLSFTMPIELYSTMAIKFHMINIRWGNMFCGGGFLDEIINFSLLMWKLYCWFEFPLFYAGCLRSYFL